MTTKNILLAVMMIPVFAIFFSLPFLIIKLQTDEAMRDPRDLPLVKIRLLTRICICFVAVCFVVWKPSIGGFVLALGFLLPGGAYSLGKFIMLKKFEKQIKGQQSSPSDVATRAAPEK